MEKCRDPKFVWHARRTVCHKTVDMLAATRMHEEEHKARPWHDGTFTRWAKEYSAETPNRFDDGVTIWVSEDPDPDAQTDPD